MNLVATVLGLTMTVDPAVVAAEPTATIDLAREAVPPAMVAADLARMSLVATVLAVATGPVPAARTISAVTATGTLTDAARTAEPMVMTLIAGLAAPARVIPTELGREKIPAT